MHYHPDNGDYQVGPAYRKNDLRHHTFISNF